MTNVLYWSGFTCKEQGLLRLVKAEEDLLQGFKWTPRIIGRTEEIQESMG